MNVSFIALQLPLYKLRTWLFILAFTAGNLLLPQLVHLIPKGGLIFLPIYFFTLIAAYKFGPAAGLCTAFFSPLINHALFGMPPASVLPIILIKSFLLATIAGYVANRYRKISIIHILLVVAGYQLTGSLAEWAITQSAENAMQDLSLGIPGMLLQLFGGFLLLKKLADYEP
jgi:hypothetical protein